MFRTYLFVAAVLLAIAPASFAQASKPVESASVQKDAQKPVSITVPNDFVLVDDLPIGGNCTFVSETIFLADVKVGAETIQKGDLIVGNVTVKDLKSLPKGMKILKGTKLTLPPGGELPKPPAPVPAPKRFTIGNRAVTEDKLDDPAVQKAALKYLLTKVAELDSRVTQVEKDVLKIKKILTPEEKAQRSSMTGTGQYDYCSTTNVVAINNRPVRFVRYCANTRAYLYEYIG